VARSGVPAELDGVARSGVPAELDGVARSGVPGELDGVARSEVAARPAVGRSGTRSESMAGSGDAGRASPWVGGVAPHAPQTAMHSTTRIVGTMPTGRPRASTSGRVRRHSGNAGLVRRRGRGPVKTGRSSSGT
jgi:hypothetical protein